MKSVAPKKCLIDSSDTINPSGSIPLINLAQVSYHMGDDSTCSQMILEKHIPNSRVVSGLFGLQAAALLCPNGIDLFGYTMDTLRSSLLAAGVKQVPYHYWGGAEQSFLAMFFLTPSWNGFCSKSKF